MVKKNTLLEWTRKVFGTSWKNILFNVINYLIFLLFTLVMLYPFLYVLKKSLESTVLVDGVPQLRFSFASYWVVLQDKEIVRSFITTVIVLVVKVAVQLTIEMMMAYALSKFYLKGRKLINLLLLITMLFSGGMIPSYILITQVLQWRNNFLVYIIPGAIAAYDVFVIKSFLQGIPSALEEAAMLDGANSFVIFSKIYLPLCGPIIATIGLWAGVGLWNNWMTGVLYITDSEKRLFQHLLRDILITASSSDASGMGGNDKIMAMADNVKMATVIIGIIPIVVIYPFVQKYFVKGMLTGSVKG